MLAGERRFEIVNMLSEKNFISVHELSKLFSIHETTIRRDLEILEKEGKVLRVHGGVSPVNLKHSEPLFEMRKTEFLDEKIRIGQFAVNLISDGDNIILDSGTTTLQIALAIKLREDFTNLTVITNDIKIASILNSSNGVTVIVTGGLLYQNSFMLNGQLANNALGCLNVDKVFLATPALDLRSGLTHFDEVQATTKQYMSKASSMKIVVTDSSKVAQKALFTFLPLNKIDLLVTDQGLPEEVVRLLKNNGVKKIERI